MHKTVKEKPGSPWRLQDVGDVRAMGYLQRKGGGTNPRERSVLQSTKLTGVGDLKSVLTSDTEMQGLEFAQMVFSLALVQYFLTMLTSPTFWNNDVYYVLLNVESM